MPEFMDCLFDIMKVVIDPLFVIFLLMLISLIVFWRASKNKTGALVLLLTIVLFYAASIFPVANYLCRYLEKDYFEKTVTADQNTDVIIVLGGGSKDINTMKNTFLTEITSARILRAVELYHKNGAAVFVCSGKGEGSIPEAEIMASLAERLGVPKGKIKIENKSVNTWQNAAEINKMLANKKQSMGIVTSAYHMKRTEREFNKYFENVFPLPANYLYASTPSKFATKYMPQSRSLNKSSMAIKEIFARLWYSLYN